MIIHPELRALRGDDSPQRDAQTALFKAVGAWKGMPAFAVVAADLDRFAGGEAFAMLPSLSAIFAPDSQAALDFVASFTAIATSALEAAPLGHVPLRHFTDGCTSTLLLAHSGSVTLSLVALDAIEVAARPAPRNISFGPNETWELVLAGRAIAEVITCTPDGPLSARLDRRELAVQPGCLMMRDCQREARLLRELDTTLVTLRLQRRCADAGPVREYDLASGALVHQAAGNPRDSRIEMMLALLGRMRRTDAAPQMAALALGEGSSALRWQALRECLALDTQIGFQTLCRLAASGGDGLAGPAGALRAQLIEMHPQLQELATCPA